MRWIAQNPGLEIVLFNDFEMNDFIDKYLIDPDLLNFVKKLPVMGMVADFFRYLALYELGGIYVDIDIEPHTPINKWPDFPFNKKSVLIQ